MLGLNILFRKIKGCYQYLGQFLYLFSLTLAPLITTKQRLWKRYTFPRTKEQSAPAIPIAHKSLKRKEETDPEIQSLLIWVQPPEP